MNGILAGALIVAGLVGVFGAMFAHDRYTYVADELDAADEVAEWDGVERDGALIGARIDAAQAHQRANPVITHEAA